MNKDYNWIADQDYEIAKGLSKKLRSFSKPSKQRFYFENIFLDITDRTESHPRIDIVLEERKYFIFSSSISSFVKYMGFGNQRIAWKYDNNFDQKNYENLNWVHPICSSYKNFKDQLDTGKKDYLNNQISYLDYWLLRSKIYFEISTQEKEFFKGVDKNKYERKMIKILGYSAVPKAKFGGFLN